MKKLLKLFICFFKIGLFTFGGGYAMISVISSEIVEKRKWISNDEYLDIIAIAVSTPGPLAINTATYVGYKIGGFFGSLFATFGVVLPSFVIIYCISLFFQAFISLSYVKYAFMGIQVGVSFIIVRAGINMFLSIKKNLLNIVLFLVSVITFLLLTFFSVKFSSIYFILSGALLGIILYLIALLHDKSRGAK